MIGHMTERQIGWHINLTLMIEKQYFTKCQNSTLKKINELKQTQHITYGQYDSE